MPGWPSVIPLDSFDNLERTLVELQAVYEATPGREERQKLRSLLIRGKSKARLAAANAKNEAKRAQKMEMALWILTWLENPPVFADWVNVRRKTLDALAPAGDTSKQDLPLTINRRVI
jgi:hypothetical protein